MAKHKTAHKKIRLAKANKRTRWAPFWAVFKKFGKGKKIHPARLTANKRNWRRTKLDLKNKKYSKRELTRKSGKITKKIRYRI